MHHRAGRNWSFDFPYQWDKLDLSRRQILPIWLSIVTNHLAFLVFLKNEKCNIWNGHFGEFALGLHDHWPFGTSENSFRMKNSIAQDRRNSSKSSYPGTFLFSSRSHRAANSDQTWAPRRLRDHIATLKCSGVDDGVFLKMHRQRGPRRRQWYLRELPKSSSATTACSIVVVQPIALIFFL